MKQKCERLVFLGPPGAGKGTQAQRVAQILGLKKLSTGDILRDAVRQGTPLGAKVEGYMKRGVLVPDDVILAVMEEAMEASHWRFILDGFPRTVAQAEALDRMLGDRGYHLDAVVFLDVSDEEIIQRLSGRRICPQCGRVYHVLYDPPKEDERCDRCGVPLVQRPDDREEVIQKRLDVYREQTEPVLQYYSGSGRPPLRIEGVGEVEEVSRRILDTLPLCS